MGKQFSKSFLSKMGFYLVLIFYSFLFSPEGNRQDTSKVAGLAEESSQAIIELGDVSNAQSLVEVEYTIVQLTDSVIEIRNVRLEVVKGVLVYIYGGVYNCHEKIETHLLTLQLARQFILKGLVEILTKHLMKSFSLENFVRIFNLGTQHRNVRLEKACIDFFKDNVDDIIANGNFSELTSVDTHLQALELARQFNLKSLEKILIDQLVESITMNNFTDFFNLKTRYENAKLDTTCDDFLQENSEKITADENFYKLTRVSLLSLLDSESFGADEIDIFRAAERWAGVNKPNKETVNDIVKKIRLATISQKDLFNVVKCSKELPNIDIMDALQSIVAKDAASTNFRRQQGRVASSNVVFTVAGAYVTGGSSSTSFDPMNCIDGDEKSSASVTENSPLTITLGHPYRLSSVRLKINAGGTSYAIESSPDRESWEEVGGETKGKRADVWRTFEFSRRVVRHFRVTVKKIGFFGWLDLFHFESPASTTAETNSSLNQ